jgi:hypothetical protein
MGGCSARSARAQGLHVIAEGAIRLVGVSWILLLLLAGIAALFELGPLCAWPLAPSAVCALAAWAGVNGSDRDVLPRVWLIGLVLDALDPGSTIFFSLALLLSTLAFFPLRRLFFRRSLLGWSLWCFALVLALSACDRLSGGHPPIGGTAALLSRAFLSALLVIPLGFLLNVLPPRWHPLGDTRR